MSEPEFHAKTREAEGTQTPANPISLADVIVLGVVPHWTEAVAVVEALCAALPAGEGGEVLVPELPDVVITRQGAVMVRRGARGAADIHDLGHLLYLLLEAGSAPLALRLFAVHAMGAGTYTTVSAFADALAYYAQPGRGELIRALYDRCLEVPLDTSRPVADQAPEDAGTVSPRIRWPRIRSVVLV